MAEEFQVIDDPDDPRLKDTPLNTDSAGTFDDLLADNEPEKPEVQGAGTFDDIKQNFDEARTTFSGNRKIVLQSLKDYGATDTTIAALMGDIQQESNFNPIASGDGGTSHGLLQIGTPMYRQFEQAAAAAGVNPSDPNYVYAQVPFVLDRFKAQHPDRWETMQNMTSAADAIEIFRGDPDWGYGVTGKRHAYANKFQNILQNVPADSLLEGDGSGNSTFGDLIGDQDIDTTKPPPSIEVDDADEVAFREDPQLAAIPEPTTPIYQPIVEGTRVASGEKEGGTPPSIPRPSPSPSEPPTFTPPAFPAPMPIPTTAAPQEMLVGTPTGPTIPEPDVAPSNLTPLQQSFVNMGSAAVDWVPTEALGNAAAAAKETASGFVPKTLPEVGNFIAENFSPLPGAKEGVKQAYGSVRDFVAGKPINQSVLENYPGVDQLTEADKTPPFSKERFKAGFEMTAQLGGVAAGGVGLKTQAKPRGAMVSDKTYFHGTPESFDTALTTGLGKNQKRFLHEEGIWFAPNRGKDSGSSWVSDATRYSGDTGMIISAKLKFKNPYRGDVDELVSNKINAKWLKENGYDGFIDDKSGSGMAVVLDPDQIIEVGREHLSQPPSPPKKPPDSPPGIPPEDLPYSSPQLPGGPQRARSELMRINPGTLLRRKLRAEERAGVKGFKRGLAQMEKESREAAADIRETLRTADQWMDADLNTVLEKLQSFSKHLPLHERGKLNTAFARVMQKPPPWTRDPAVVKRRAERVLNRMAEMIYETNKKKIVKDIDKGLKKIIDSPSVVLSEKRLAQVMQRTFNAFKEKMSLDMLEAMHARMKEIEAQGRQMFKDKEHIKAARDIITRSEIVTQGTLKADTPQQLLMPIGEVPSYWQRWRQTARNMPNIFQHFKLTLTPMDWQFLRFDGQGIGGGALHRNLKLPIDVRYSQFMDHLDSLQARRTAIKEKYKLDKRNYNRIAAHAELRQAGGEANLKAQGISDADIRKYSNLGSLSPGERALLKVDDAILNELEPLIREAYERDWNHDIGPKVQGYYPRIRNWDLYDSLSFEQRAAHHRMSKTESGFAQQRKDGAVSKNILDSDEIMNKHLEDVLYTINVGPEVSRGAKLVKQDWFREQVGTAGQKVFADWYDTLARNGGVESARRIQWLDWTRKNIGGAQLAFRATTILLQPTALLNTMPFLSVRNTAHGISSVMSREGRAWIMKTFPEVRGAVTGSIDDPAFREYSGKMVRAGFTPIRVMDGFARMSAVEAAYRDALEKRGIAFDRNMTPHPEAVNEAQRLVRMTQATGLAKDAPAALARGSLTGNLSMDKAILQFQNFIIHRWSLTKFGGQQLFKGSPAEGAKILSYVIAATYAEQLGREGIANSIRAIFGGGSPQEISRRKTEEETPLPLRVAEKAAIDMATSMPIVSNISGMARYDSSGVPVADTLKDITDGAVALSRGKPGGVVKGAQAAGAIVGVPTGQLGDLIARMVRTQANEDYVGPYAPRSTGPGRTAPERGSGPGRTAPSRGY